MTGSSSFGGAVSIETVITSAPVRLVDYAKAHLVVVPIH